MRNEPPVDATRTPASAPEISVVVPTHDRARRLSALLESLREQSVGPERFEVVVVDDGSRDETPEVLRAEQDRGLLALRWVRLEPAKGPAAARNTGWKLADAPFIAFVDDDCRACAGWLAAGLAAWDNVPTRLVQGRTDPDPREQDRQGPFARTLRVHELGPYFQTCNVFYARSLLAATGGFDERTFTMPGGEDADLAWRCFDAGADAVFAPDARVMHAVQRLGPLGKLRVAWHWSESMLVYKRFPELRDAVFTRRVFWKQSHYELFRAAAVLFLPRRLAFLRPLVLRPYLRNVLIRRHLEGGSVVSALFYPLEDIVEVGAMVRASIRYRMLVL